MGKGRRDSDGLDLPRLRFDYIEDLGRLAIGQSHGTGWAFGMLDDETVRAVRTPIAECVRCGSWAEDPTRSVYGEIVPDHEFSPEENRDPVCFLCLGREERERQETEVLELLESKLGLAEKDREALRLFIETIFTDPAKILQVQDVDNRVRSLERQNVIMWGIVGVLVAAVIALTALLVSLVAA